MILFSIFHLSPGHIIETTPSSHVVTLLHCRISPWPENALPRSHARDDNLGNISTFCFFWLAFSSVVVSASTFICSDPEFSNRLSGHSSSLLPASFSHVTRESVVDTAGNSSEPKATASKGMGSVTSSYPERVRASSKNLLHEKTAKAADQRWLITPLELRPCFRGRITWN